MNSLSYTFTQISFVALTVIFVGWFVKDIFSGLAATSLSQVQKGKLKFKIIIGLLVWLLLVSGLSLSGFLQDFSTFPPRMFIVLVVPLVTIVAITFSSPLKEILMNIPPHNLIRLQVFRVFVEILLWILFLENLVPKQMTFEGMNFDIVAGLSAPLIAYLFQHNKKVVIVWNIVCLGLLINIVTVAVLSLPTPLRYFMNEPANTMVAYFPITFLPAFLVPLAYTLHFFSLRQLVSK
jgi:hypothetical protein